MIMTGTEGEGEHQEAPAAENDPLSNFLTECLKNADRVAVVWQQLTAADIEYEDIFESDRKNLNEMLESASVKALYRSRIIRVLSRNPQSGVSLNEDKNNNNNSNTGNAVIILSAEQNEMIAGLQQKIMNVSKNVSMFEEAIVSMEDVADLTVAQIEVQYKTILELLVQRKLAMFTKVQRIKSRKMNILKSQFKECSFVEEMMKNMNKEMQEILNESNSNIDIAQKQSKINAFINKMKSQITLDMDKYFTTDVKLGTVCKIEYECDPKPVESVFALNANNVDQFDDVFDCDLRLMSIAFPEKCANSQIDVEWKIGMNMNNMEAAKCKYNLQCMSAAVAAEQYSGHEDNGDIDDNNDSDDDDDDQKQDQYHNHNNNYHGNATQAQHESNWETIANLVVNQKRVQLKSGRQQLLLLSGRPYLFRLVSQITRNTDPISCSNTVHAVTNHVPLKLDSVILSVEEQAHLSEMVENVTTRYTGACALLLRGSRDGFTKARFHELCDRKMNTITIVHSEFNHVFGGFTPLPWSSTAGNVVDESKKSFIFLLRTQMQEYQESMPYKWKIRGDRNRRAIYCNSSYGPVFGDGPDFGFNDNCNTNKSWSRLNSSSCTYDAPSDNSLLAGNGSFKVTDYEVWQLV